MASMTLQDFRQNFPLSTLGIPTLVLLIMAMFIVPLAPIVLDLLFTFNIVAALVIVMIAIGTSRPMDFSSFPSILLLATLLRLALNVASTRIVLVDGHEGSDAAGKVIEAFGEFVIAGNYLVGFIIFSILMLINFIVVTKGAGRVSEVIARFTLDAMPGKQMAIDADLNSGVIDQDMARTRRDEISQEADFYGSMDGASKFVRGDAVAGLLILLINIVGGLIIGVAQHDLSFSEAGRVYILLTIGDGLVAQIPSLFLSLATAIIVTRVTTSQTMTEQAASQLANPTALFISAGILAVIGLVPGMPSAVFITLATSTAGIALFLTKQKFDISKAEQTKELEPEAPKELDWDDVEQVDVVGLEIGYGLIPLVNPETGGQLMPRVKGIRKKLSAELGFLVQPIRIRDALNLDPDTYHIVLNGVVRGRGTEIRVGQELAINPGNVHGEIEGGVPTVEAAFGLPAFWIDPSQRDLARTLGYTVVDSSTAIATHLNKILRENAAELLSHDETQQLLDKFAQKSPKLIEDLVPGKLSLAIITKVLQNLLSEAVSIRDIRTIMETLSEESGKTQDPDDLTALIRPKLGRMIVQNLVDMQENLPVMTLDPNLEQLLHNSLQQAGQGKGPVLEPGLAESFFKAVRDAVTSVEDQGHPAVLVTSPTIRPWLAKMLKHRASDLTVLSYSEIPDDQAVQVVFTVQAENSE